MSVITDVFFIDKDPDEIIERFWTQTDDAGEFKSGLCGEFALALNRLFAGTIWEIYTESFPGIHYFVGYDNYFYDVNGIHSSQQEVIDNNEYYSNDYDNEEVKYKEIKKEEVLSQDEETIEYLIGQFLE